MRRFLCGMLAVLVSFGAVQAKVHTNKTFLMPRSHVDNMAMEYTAWHKQFRMIDDSKWGAFFQATGFYQQSENGSDLGKYFGKFNSAVGPSLSNPYAKSIQDFIEVKERAWSTTGPVNERGLLLDPRFIIHDFDDVAGVLGEERLNVKGIFRPKVTSSGIRLDYHQKLDKLAKGLYLNVSAPLVKVEHKIHVCYTGTQKKQRLPIKPNTDASLAGYLNGTLEITGTQAPLTAAKICGKQSSTGIADIEVILGYEFLYEEHKHCGIYASLTIPTSDTPEGEWLFEPVLGHAGHWAIGLGVDGAFELWQHGEKSLEFVGAAHYKYILNETERRTIGFKYPKGEGVVDPYWVHGKFVPMGWYMLGGKVGEKGTFPLANILTQDVGVEPGSQVEVLANLAFNWGNWTVDLGYNLFAREKESVVLKCKCWNDQLYAVADPSYDTTTVFGEDDNGVWNPGTYAYIKKCDLCTDNATTPVYVTHKVYSSVGYAWNGWDYPVEFGLGGSWEFGQGTNSVLDGYAVWGKFAIGF